MPAAKLAAEPELAPATLSEYDGVRSLHLGTEWIQGSMRIKQPNVVELEYVQRMLASLLWLPFEHIRAGHAVQLGLGAGAITRFTHRVLKMRTTAVELNPQVILACRVCFELGDEDERLSVQRADAAQWVTEPAHAGLASLLHVDLYDHDAAAPVLDDEAFYAACRAVLGEGGVMSVNLFGRNASYANSAARIAAVFGAGHVWSLQPTREGNTTVIAAKGAGLPERGELLGRAQRIESAYGRYGAPARKWLRMLRPYAASAASAA